MANIYKRWLCDESLKTLSSRPILIYFEFRSKPSLITVISMDPRPTNYLRQNIVFSYPEMIRVSFSLISFFFGFLLFYVIVSFYKNYFITIIIIYWFIYFHYYFFSWKLFLFFHVPECSGMFRNVPCSRFYRRPTIRLFGQLMVPILNFDLQVWTSRGPMIFTVFVST